MSIRILDDVFRAGLCSLCGSTEDNRYYKIRDSFLRFNESYLALQGITIELLELLGTTILEDRDADMCADCKDKVVSFFHFKQKVKNYQQLREIRKCRQKEETTKKALTSVVQHTLDVVNDYITACSVTSITIDSTRKRLIVESGHARKTQPQFKISAVQTVPKVEPTSSSSSYDDESEDLVLCMVKEEPRSSDDEDLAGPSIRVVDAQDCSKLQNIHSKLPPDYIPPPPIASFEELTERENMLVAWKSNLVSLEASQYIENMLSYYANKVYNKESRTSILRGLIKSFFSMYFEPQLIRRFGWTSSRNRLAFNELQGHIELITSIMSFVAPGFVIPADIHKSISEVFIRMHESDRLKKSDSSADATLKEREAFDYSESLTREQEGNFQTYVTKKPKLEV